MAEKLEIVKINDKNVEGGKDVKNIPSFRGKVVINMNNAWKERWDQYAAWVSPCGNKISNLTQDQYMQLVDLGVPVKKRPNKNEVDNIAQSLKDFWNHYDIMRYLHHEHGIKIDLEVNKEDDDEDEEEENTEVPMEGITIDLIPGVSVTKSPTKFNGVAAYYFTVKTYSRNLGMQVEVNTHHDSIVGVMFLAGNTFYRDKRKTPSTAASYSVSELSARLKTDLDNIFELGNHLRRATNYIHHNLPNSLKRYFTDDFRIWVDTFGSYQISIRA